MQNQTFKLSLKPNDYPPNVPFVYADQYDVGRTFVATVYDADGTLYNFTTETVTVVGTKPSGTGFSYSATASGNTVTFETTGQMTVVAGNVTCGIIIEKDGDRIGTLHFVLHVQPAALSSDTIIDSDDFGSIISDAVAEYMEEHGIVIDDTLSVAGAAADAKATGDAIDELKSAFDLDSLTPGVKSALLNLLEHVAYIDEDGQDYYDALYDALYNRYWQVTNNLTNCTTSNESVQTIKDAAYSATITASTGYVMTGATVSITMGGVDVTASVYSNGVITIPAVTGALVITISAAAKSVSSISAVYTQSGTVYDIDDLDDLKDNLVVTATYDDSTTEIVPASSYTLSGTLAEETSTITVSFGGKTTTFDVTVTSATVYKLSEPFVSDGTNSIDTGVALTDNAVTTLLMDVTVTTFNSAQNTIFGNMLLSTESQLNAIRTQLQSAKCYIWGCGLSWSAGENFAANGDRIRFVLVFTNGESTYTQKWAIKNVTQNTSNNDESTVQNVYHNSNTIRLGKTYYNGFTGTINSFELLNHALSDNDIADFLANGETA